VDVTDAALAQAYNDVRSDKVATTWCVFAYQGAKKIVLYATGQGGWDEFTATLKDDVCQFGFVRVMTGDEESKRAKFVFVSWVGQKVGSLQRAKVSVHKANIKQIVRDYAAEIHAEDRADLEESKVMAIVVKAGGANYGTGSGR